MARPASAATLHCGNFFSVILVEAAMNEHLVLIFAYHFPPENAIGGERPFRFTKYLRRLGYRCQVFTAAEQSGCDDFGIQHVADRFFTGSRHDFGWQLERAVRRVGLPGVLGLRWYYDASRAASSYIRSHSGAGVTIFSTYPPLGAHLAAWRLARKTGLRWIADFRDPMLNERVNELINPFQRRIDRWLERRFLRRADAVIANTDNAMLRLQEKLPFLKGKVHVIWNGFDPEERIEPLPVSGGDYRVLSHTGELYEGRSATPILESIARLMATNRLPANGVRVRLVGEMEPAALANEGFLDRARTDGWLEMTPERIPKREALQILRSSDFLLLLQPQSSIQAPGKLFEYLQIGRPILAFVQRDSPSEKLLARSGVPFRCVYQDSGAEIIDRTVEEFFRLPSTAVTANAWFNEQFNAESQTRQLAAIIRSLQSR
jgi:hypothetical protein